MKTNKIYLSLGSNLGNRSSNITKAGDYLIDKLGNLLSSSSLYKSFAWGYISKNYFLNMVISISTNFSPQDILSIIKSIEIDMGRYKKKSNEYEDRIIDIDILMLDDLVFSSQYLQIPHKLMHKRRFVLEPLNEICPNLKHPLIKKTIREILNNCDDSIQVKKLLDS